MEVAVPVATKHGIIKGRDALFLDRVLVPTEGQLILCGEINTYGGEDEKYQIEFRDVVYLSMVELDFYNGAGTSSFGIIENSKILHEMRRTDHSGKLNDGHSHFYFYTYDTVFEVIASGYKLEFYALTGPP